MVVVLQDVAVYASASSVTACCFPLNCMFGLTPMYMESDKLPFKNILGSYMRIVLGKAFRKSGGVKSDKV